MTLDQVLTELLRNSPFLGSTLLVLYLSLPQLAERFAVVAKIWRVLSPKYRRLGREAEKKADEDREQEAREADAERRRILAEAQAVAQTTATTSVTEALTVVTKQCKQCRDELVVHRDVMGKMIDVLEEILPIIPRDHQANARASIRLARSIM